MVDVGELVADVDVVEVAEMLRESVETTSPLPFNTTPSWSAQQFGLLSQQKLPSEQVLTRGKKPVPSSINIELAYITEKGSGYVFTELAKRGTIRPRKECTRRP